MRPQLFLHIGYPKTATTTLQTHLFPKHPDINYLGKFIPNHDYTKPDLKSYLNDLINSQSHNYKCNGTLKHLINQEMIHSNHLCTLISNEAFLHPWAIDVETVARRAYKVFNPCKIIIVIREQHDALWSFYRAHGRHGQYMFVNLTENDTVSVQPPISASDWLELQSREFNKNFASTLLYSDVINSYLKLFGKENVLVLCYEQLDKNLADFTNHLSRWMGINNDMTHNLLDGKRENITPPILSNEFAHKETEAKSNFIKLIPPSITNEYRKGNQYISDKLGIKLAKYNYPL